MTPSHTTMAKSLRASSMPSSPGREAATSQGLQVFDEGILLVGGQADRVHFCGERVTEGLVALGIRLQHIERNDRTEARPAGLMAGCAFAFEDRAAGRYLGVVDGEGERRRSPVRDPCLDARDCSEVD